AERLRFHQYRVFTAGDGEEGLNIFRKEGVDLVLLDLMMPELDGIETLNRMKKEEPEVLVIMLTAFGTIEKAVEAMKKGAYDFIPKPCEPEHILLTIEKALERKNLVQEKEYLKKELDSQYDIVWGESSEMKKIKELIFKVASTKSTILIQGESGTGKQVLARAIHNLSNRKDKPFVYVNCVALSEQLLESDLFGHEKGAFTGAYQRKKGRLETAHTGTVFLDEIGDITPVIQTKFLHFIESEEFERVGGTQTLKVDARIIAATNRDLSRALEDKKFREDLLFRLNVISITIPPLRNRKEDITTLANHFLQKFNQEMKKRIISIDPQTLEVFSTYSWPGNIRELQNILERGVVLAPSDTITTELVLPQLSHTKREELLPGIPLEDALKKFKKEFITRTLSLTKNNQSQAAKLLDIQRTYLNRLIKELEIDLGSSES
ncbi:MAG: sigma-54 dependent transcriptional regulator, partial [candidate division Zixibacteria bacterium]|nr:sigma-54 dependent transcriptional regulator [candidate division Zixibacteria bacterium]